MNTYEFKEVASTVITTKPNNYGTELWVRYKNGRELAYVVPSADFQAREGHEITEL